jgi:hypothetical protein
MDQAHLPDQLQRYRVRLGHAEVRVEGHSPHEAIQLARRQLCRELPRLWDVIQRLEDNRFHVAVEEN